MNQSLPKKTIRRVIKIGGSLLLRKDLTRRMPRRIKEIAHGQPSQNVAIVGGGELVDAVRSLDQCRSLDATQTHWRCIELLQHTFEIFHQWFPTWHRIDSLQQLHGATDVGFVTDRPTLVNVNAFYNRENAFDLPTDWRTTTDSLAALLAKQVDAAELVLLKSCEIDGSRSTTELASAGIIDTTLPKFNPVDWRLRIEQF
ncbi:Amino acid kinase family protein [Planctomycetes bacterium CA13]|uniref:Amino acid kinase family protein n=1 Tax=Novipirellula herctigrandis TaxID=2527986 RepID=A0A5C5Z9E3_9BACT|nr:Amino acid kinase family protein [Planctomycetes bacterium CA13]